MPEGIRPPSGLRLRFLLRIPTSVSDLAPLCTPQVECTSDTKGRYQEE